MTPVNISVGSEVSLPEEARGFEKDDHGLSVVHTVSVREWGTRVCSRSTSVTLAVDPTQRGSWRR